MHKIFDSLVHSGINPVWPSSPDTNISIGSLLTKLDEETSLLGACIQTSPWFDSAYSNQLFLSRIKDFATSKTFVPVYTVPDGTSLTSIKKGLDDSIECGFRVFKIHPRLSNQSIALSLELIDYLSSSGFLVQVCCYPFQKVTHLTTSGHGLFFTHFIDALCRISNQYSSYICLMHGFGTHILHIHNFVRHNNFLLLDLSMTMMKYAGSSLDMDLRFLFSSFDRRIILGSDYPEWTYSQLAKRITFLSEGIDALKAANVTHLNLLEALHHGSNSAL